MLHVDKTKEAVDPPSERECAVCGKAPEIGAQLASVWFKGTRTPVHRGPCLERAVRRLRGSLNVRVADVRERQTGA